MKKSVNSRLAWREKHRMVVSLRQLTRDDSWDWMLSCTEFSVAEYAAMFFLSHHTAYQRCRNAHRAGLLDRRRLGTSAKGTTQTHLYSVPPDWETRLRK
jgi:predicted glycosyl hydrolase (DUF1957 family)